MIIDDQYYDLIIVGTGASGSTLASKLAPTGKKLLILERGNFSLQVDEEFTATEVFKKDRYHANEEWYDKDGEPFNPQTNYSVGGNTKIYSGELLRMRERDFEEVTHLDGVSPEWQLKYKDFEPYYTEAEKLYSTCGFAEEDPTEPPRSEGYPQPAVSHEPHMQEICDAIAKQGLHPAHLPLEFKLANRIIPAQNYPNVTLKTGAKVVCLHISPSGTEVKAVEAEVGGQSYLFFGSIVVLSCGAVNSAALLLRSHNEKYPNGLANSSDQVGRNFMKHLMTSIVQLRPNSNSGVFQKTVCINDFYWGDNNFPYPMGNIQNTGGLLKNIMFAESPPLLSGLARLMPGFSLQQLATHSIGWWLQTEDLPKPNNRVRIQGSKLCLDYTPNNTEAHDRLTYRWINILKAVDKATGNSLLSQGVYPHAETPLSVIAHQCGTCRFGENPKTSVLNLNCRTHDIDNLYIVDGSFFPSNPAVSPALTMIANALRVGEHLIQTLK